MPLVRFHVRKYPESLKEDLEQEASIALYKASKDWDPSKSSFKTLAYNYIGYACKNYLKKVYKNPVSSSLDSEDYSLEFLFKEDSFESISDLKIYFWSNLVFLVESGFLNIKDFHYLYLKYFLHCDHRTMATYFNSTSALVAQKLRSIILKIRPHFVKSVSDNFSIYD